MILENIPVGVEVERRPGVTRWQSEIWQPVALRPGPVALPQWTLLGEADGVARFFAGSADIVLRAPDTKVLKDNAEGPSPSVFVVLRRGATPSGWRLHLVTVDPSEAHAHADVGTDLVEALPMPDAVWARLSAFVGRYHVERPEWRRRRDRADPEALGRRGPIRQGARRA